MSSANTMVSWGLDRVDNASVSSDGLKVVKQFPAGRRPSAHALVSFLAAATIATTLSIKTVEVTQGARTPASVFFADPSLRRNLLFYDPEATGRAKLAWLKEMHFTRETRDARISRALKTLAAPGPSFKLDSATWEWIAQDIDIEDI